MPRFWVARRKSAQGTSENSQRRTHLQDILAGDGALTLRDERARDRAQARTIRLDRARQDLAGKVVPDEQVEAKGLVVLRFVVSKSVSSTGITRRSARLTMKCAV